MAVVRRTERGWAGHFVGARHCRFHRNTLIDCADRRIVVSTVGAYFPPAAESLPKHLLDNVQRAGGPTQIGYNIYYETMAFEAVHDGPYLEADIELPVAFESRRSITKLHDAVDLDADAMHEAVVLEIMGTLQE